MDTENTGICGSSGAQWKHQKTASLAILRKMGLGRNDLAEKIQAEVDQYLTELSKFEGIPKDIKFLTDLSTCNVICSILVGQAFDYNDVTFVRVVELITTKVANWMSNKIQCIETFPTLHYLPGDLFGAEALNRCRREMKDLFFNHFRSLQNEYQEGNSDPDNFMAGYLNQMSKNDNSGIPNYLDEENLAAVVEDFLTVGTEPTAVTITWFVIFMIQYPEIQEKVFQEISNEIGMERTPTMQDKSGLIYLNAALMETQRLGNILPAGLPHACSKTTTLMGFRIPEGATVLANMTSVFFDKQIWGDDVATFRPERFIDDMGKLVHKEEFIPHGIGKRACMAESLAQMELFLYLASMFQRFKFVAPDPNNPPEVNEVIGAMRKPGPYKVSIITRA